MLVKLLSMFLLLSSCVANEASALKKGDSLKSQNEMKSFSLSNVKINLAPESEATITGKNEIQLESGMIHIVNPEGAFMVHAPAVKFTSEKASEFIISRADELVYLDVIKGEVEVSSPLVMTFVPEIIKQKMGFTFSERERKFERRDFKNLFDEIKNGKQE